MLSTTNSPARKSPRIIFAPTVRNRCCPTIGVFVGKLTRFANLKRDMASGMRRNSAKSVPAGGVFREAGAGVDLNRAVNGR